MLINAAIAHNIKQTYIAFSYQILFESNENNCDEIIRYDIMQLNDFDIFKQIECVSKIFLKELFNNFKTHDQIEHFINLLFNKLFKNGSIYNISHNELVMIKDYLNNAFKKK